MRRRGRRPLPGRILKASTLVKLGACKGQVRLFRKMFGSQVRITKALAERHGSKFELWFPVQFLLPKDQQAKWNPLNEALDLWVSEMSEMPDAQYDQHMKLCRRIRGAWLGHMYVHYGLDHDEAIAAARARGEIR